MGCAFVSWTVAFSFSRVGERNLRCSNRIVLHLVSLDRRHEEGCTHDTASEDDGEAQKKKSKHSSHVSRILFRGSLIRLRTRHIYEEEHKPDRQYYTQTAEEPGMARFGAEETETEREQGHDGNHKDAIADPKHRHIGL